MLELNPISILIGVLPAAIAIIALIVEGRQNRLALQTRLLLDLNKEMCTPELKSLRRKVALNLLKQRKPNFELGELLDYFSMICYLYRVKATNTELLYDQFGWWIVRYWLCARDWVMNVRKTVDPFGWENVEVVANEFIRREKKEGFAYPSDETLAYFLKVESQLYDKDVH